MTDPNAAAALNEPAGVPVRAAARGNLLSGDHVLADVAAWRERGVRSVLVTLVAIDGAAPRPLGAQMAVAETGLYSGYLSGGCLEEAVAKEALSVLGEGRSRLVRYGKGSRYLDMKLPCGSGLDLYFDSGLEEAVVSEIARLSALRRPFWLECDIARGASRVVVADGAEWPRTERRGDVLRRAVLPQPRVLLIGSGPAAAAIARLVAAAGIALDAVTPDAALRAELRALGIASHGFTSPAAIETLLPDPFTAAVVAFHEHDWEAPVLAQLLGSPCFYLGALGSKAAHAARTAKLRAQGFDAAALARVRSPIGLIPGAKSRVALAAGVLAEIAAECKSRGLMD